MKTYLGLVAVSVFLLSCTNTDRDNPNDERAINYIGKSSAEGLSSGVETGDYPSSSSVVYSSSSVKPSSSSVEPSSSSVVPSSSSVEPSSSSAEPSSSSVAPSSSSVVLSSSSNAVSSSSSYGGLCAGFDGAKRLHYGKEKEQFCDERDGKKYVYVQIDTQTWMAENLNYAASGSKCGDYDSYLSDNNTAYCDTYGRLYNWATVMGFESSCNTSTCSSQINSPHRGICPEGWHIPSDAEWDVLVTFAGGSSTAGTKLKAKSGWNGTDEYGFSALPGGNGLFQQHDVFFTSVGSHGYWQSATEGNTSNGVWGQNMNTIRNSNVNRGNFGKSHLYSVRCVRD